MVLGVKYSATHQNFKKSRMTSTQMRLISSAVGFAKSKCTRSAIAKDFERILGLFQLLALRSNLFS